MVHGVLERMSATPWSLRLQGIPTGERSRATDAICAREGMLGPCAGIDRDLAGGAGCNIALEAAPSEQEVENGATCRMAERSAASGYVEHPGEVHSCT